MPNSSPAFTPEGLTALDTAMTRATATDDDGVPGLVAAISRHGVRHIHASGVRTESGDPIDPDAIFRIASITKPITATAAMILVEDGLLRLDDPIDDLLPELADRPVLRTPESEPDDTVPALRQVTTRDLLTFTGGDGYIFAMPGTYPIQQAYEDAGITTHAPMPDIDPAPDAWLARLGSLPLLNQPGFRWRYHVSAEILGVLIARAARVSLPELMQERIFGPLGMASTAFHLPAGADARFTTCFQRDPETGQLGIYDPAVGSAWRTPPVFPNGGGDLLSTAADLLTFGEMLTGLGERNGIRILSEASVRQMTTDQVTEAQKLATGIDRDIVGFDGWGFGMRVENGPAATPTGLHAGAYGWDGGLGTSWANDPVTGLTGVLLTNLAWASPQPPPVFPAFWSAATDATR